MAEQDSAAGQTAIQSLLASGFPFQTSIAQLVRQVPGCDSVEEEVPWNDGTGDDHFLDLVVFLRNFIVVIECKKTQKEIFTFLQPASRRESVYRSRCAYPNHTRVDTMRIRAALCCADWKFRPESEESAFCVVSTSESGKDQRLLEKDAQLLIRGIHNFGRRVEYDHNCAFLGHPIVPVIVTNAKLFSTRYEPEQISLDTGQLPTVPEPDLISIEWVRFRKAFTADSRPGDRTVFVVAARSLHKFLCELDSVDLDRSNEFTVYDTTFIDYLNT